MLAVSKLSPGQEAYYERSVAAGIDDYYTGRGESPGIWVGRGSAELELEGVVGEGALGRLIGGRHPGTNAVLRSHPAKKPGRRMASAGRRADLEALPACRWLPLPGAASLRADPLARRRVARAGERDGRDRRRPRRRAAGLLTAASAGTRLPGATGQLR